MILNIGLQNKFIFVTVPVPSKQCTKQKKKAANF